MEKLNKILIPIAIVAAGLLISGGIIYVNQKKPEKPVSGFINAQEASSKAIEYIDQNILKGKFSASLENVTEESGLYKLKIKVGGQEFYSYVTKDGKILFLEEGIDLSQKPALENKELTETEGTIGNFTLNQEEICKENGKPIIYFFGSQSCPHCRWEHPVFEKVALKFKDYIVFHNNMDSTADMEVFQKYSNGAIPTLVLGCKYSRVGSGENMGEEKETKVLTALICKLTQNQPSDVCNSVQDLINQVK